jgi:glycosyltransferase involved in cell wall biosynthesis
MPIVVAYTPYPWTHALTILRIVRPLQEAGIDLIHGNELDVVNLEKVSLGDCVLIQRDFPYAMELYERLVSRAHAEGKPVIYEIDDLLIDMPEDHPDRRVDYYTPAVFAMTRAIIEADLVTVSTPTLAAYLRPFNPNIQVLPNCLDPQLWKPRPVQVSQGSQTGSQWPVVIGYMGSDTHQPDLEPLVPVFERLLEQYGDRILVRFWGGKPPLTMQGHPQVEWIQMEIREYAEFAAYFSRQECDICIAPLKDSTFNICKSSIKFLEYSILGIPGVYSRIPPYESVIQPGDNGFIAGTSEEWEQYLRRLIDEPALRAAVGKQAQSTILKNWLLPQHAPLWKNAISQALALVAAPTSRDGELNFRAAHQRMFIRQAIQVRDWQHKIYQEQVKKDQAIQELRSHLAEAEQATQELRSRLAETEQTLQEMHRSRAWRLVQWIWKLRRSIDR